MCRATSRRTRRSRRSRAPCARRSSPAARSRAARCHPAARRPASRPARADRSARRSRSGLPVSAATTGAPGTAATRAPSSSRSHTSRCSAGSPRGTRAGSRRSRGAATTTPDESSIEPPARVPCSSTTGRAPSSAARTAAQSPAMPAPATTSGSRGQASANVDLCSTYSMRMPSGPVDEDRVGVRRVDDRLDLDPERLGLGGGDPRRLDEQAEVVQQRPLGGSRLAVDEDEPRAADLDRAQRGRAAGRSARRTRRSARGRASRTRRGRGRSRPSVGPSTRRMPMPSPSSSSPPCPAAAAPARPRGRPRAGRRASSGPGCAGPRRRRT